MSLWEYGETELFRYGEGEISIYHLFSAVSAGGSVLVFAEARHGDGGDAGSVHDIVMRKSTDGGKNFSQCITLLFSQGVHCWCNPTPVYDLFHQRLHLFFADNRDNAETRLYSIYSDDFGDTWTSPKEMEISFPFPFTLPGPGHGLCLKRGAHRGRLLVQLWHRERDTRVPVEQRGYRVSLLYSDDHGATWRHGQSFGESFCVNESRLVETKKDLVWVCRTKDTTPVVMRSCDGGESFCEPKPLALPPARCCDMGAIGFPLEKEGFEDLFLISRVSHLSKRRDMEIAISYDGGKSFSATFPLIPGDAMPGYSDLCLLETENDPVLGVVHCRDNHVLFSRVSLQTLTGGEYDGTKRSVWLS